MALTLVHRSDIQTGKFPVVIGDRRLWIGTVQFDSSYPTGGELLTPSDFGLSEIDAVIADEPVAMSRLVAWDSSTGKLKLFTAVSTEAANASDQSTITVFVVIIGK